MSIGSATWWRARGTAQVATVGVVLAATGVAAGAAVTTSRPATRSARVSLAYTCPLPHGAKPVSVLAQAVFPATGKVRQPIRASGAAVTVTLPPAAVAALAVLHEATVSSSTRFDVVIPQGGASSGTVAWLTLTAPATPLPAKGGLVLSASGAAPPVTVTAAGGVSFTTAGLSLVLAPHRRGGAASSPMVRQVRCTLRPGQDATLDTVPVGAAAGTPGPHRSARPRAASRAANKFCPPLHKALKLNPRFPPPKPPSGSTVNHSPGIPPFCAFTTGYSDIKKLKGATLLGPGLANISPFLNSYFNFSKNYFQQDSAAEFSFHGRRQFPPAKATFLGFGFEPISAMMQLNELGTVNIVTISPLTACSGKGCKPTITTVSSRIYVRVFDVKVNGVPLNVGPHCQTAPFDAILAGRSDTKPSYQFSTGGPITGNITIKQFHGCGAGENLNPLFNVSISGPRNFTLLTQGRVCEQAQQPVFCPPKKPRPIR